jgi:CxxC motif-containing protein (DUF1111 family)
MRRSPFAVAAFATAMVVVSAEAADFGAPIRGLTQAQLERFNEGKEAFEETETAEDGLGPVFNGASCAFCHSLGGTGGASDLVETRFGITTDGAFDHLADFGGSLIQTDGIGVAGTCEYIGEIVPPEATIVAGRRTTSLFGLGLVDAVPDAAFVALAKLQKRYQPETAGRPNFVQSVSAGKLQVGKFGWKSQVANLFDFSGDAYLNEMGITTPFFPDESCPQGDCDLLSCDPVPDPEDDGEDALLFRDFMTLLAPVARAGATLGDGIEQSRAKGRDMRTAPLWGVRLLAVFLHDGRAHTLEEAILAHEGQGKRAKQRFVTLSAHKQSALIAFLSSL